MKNFLNKPNQVIQSFWVGERLSNMERLCVQSFLQNGHDFHLYSYENIENVPRDVILKNANDIIPYSKIFKDSSGGFSGFSNWFRYKLLYEYGGWWVDMDAVCMKFFNITEDYCFSTENDIYGNPVINCGFIKSPPQADFLAEMLNYIELQDHSNVNWGEFGPRLISAVVQNYESETYIKAPEVFCPIHWSETSQVINNHRFDFSEETLAIHLWNEIWRRKHLDKDAIYHSGSIYEQLKKRFGINS